MKFADVLKRIRATAYRHPGARVLIVVPSAQRNAVVWDEAKFLFETSSLALVEARRVTYTMTLERDVIVRFCTVEDDFDRYKYAGGLWSHIVVFGDTGEYPELTMPSLKAVWRSANPEMPCEWFNNVGLV